MSARHRLFALIATGLFVSANAVASDWPTDRGNNARTGASEESLSLPLDKTWSVTAPAAPRLAWSSAEGRVMEGKLIGSRIRFDDAFRTVVSEGRVYFGSTVDHQVHCVDLASGRELWSFFTGGPVRLAPTVSGKNLLFGSDDGCVYSIDKTSGSLNWQHRVAPRDEWLLARGDMISKWPVRTGVLVHRGVAYFGAGIFPHEDIYLEGVDIETGRKVWGVDNVSSQDAGRNDLSPQGYLLAKGDLLVVPSGGSLPGVFDLKTGELLHKRTHSWRTTAGGVVGGTRVVLADGQLYASGDQHYLAMAERTGDVGFAWIEGRQLSIDGDQAYVVTGTRVSRLNRLQFAKASQRRHALEEEIGRLAKEKDPDAREKAIARREEVEKEMRQLSATGVLWKTATTDESSLLVTGKHVIVGGPGRVTAYQKETGEVAWSQAVDGDARGLAISDGRLLVSTDAGTITCFGSSGSQTSPKSEAERKTTAFAPDLGMEQAAKEILAATGVTRGYCLVVGSERGQLARELALNSDLRIYCIEPDEAKARESREKLQAAGLYGHRVSVLHEAFDKIPFSNYFANLIVSETALRQDNTPFDLDRVSRHLKPVGGVLCLGKPGDSAPQATANIASAVQNSSLADQATVARHDGWTTVVRGKLPGAGDWSHQYGNASNTAVSQDQRVKGDLGVLWYGDPGPGEVVNRHDGAVGPLAMNGKLFVQGENTIKAYDAYNGVHLWTHENPGAIRTGVFQNQNPANLAAGEGCLFHFVGDKCLQLDADSGKLIAMHSLPAERDSGRHEWGYVAIENGKLIGAATLRPQIAERERRRGQVTKDSTDSLFAIDIATGKHAWSYHGQNISHHTIAISPDKVCFIDSSITSQQRDDLLKADKSSLANLTGKERDLAEERLKSADVRMAVALKLESGEKLWARPVDVTDCSDIGTGGGKLTMMFADGKLVLCGANANGHYWQQFVSGEFERRRLVVLSADDGYKLWAKDANYRHRPIVIGQQILAEPWSFDLTTGEQKTRLHPITGEAVPWSIMRTGHHCGMVTASSSGMLLFRSGATGFADLNNDEGIRHFGGHRLGCWINAIAAEGLVMIPEASAGCVCQFSIASTIVLEPREARRPWTIYSAVGSLVPVQHLSMNLGAPGDRKDADGMIWFSYPRAAPYKETALDVKLDVHPQFATGGRFENIVQQSGIQVDSPTPWIYESWASNLKSMTVPVSKPDSPAANYLVRLHFADLREHAAATDMTVTLESPAGRKEVPVNLSASETSKRTPTVIDVPDLPVSGVLTIGFQASQGLPFINAVEIVRQPPAQAAR